MKRILRFLVAAFILLLMAASAFAAPGRQQSVDLGLSVTTEPAPTFEEGSNRHLIAETWPDMGQPGGANSRPGKKASSEVSAEGLFLGTGYKDYVARTPLQYNASADPKETVISLGRGVTVSETMQVSMTRTISLSVTGNLAEAINMEFGASSSGSITLSRTVTLDPLPNDSPFRLRTYYKQAVWDKYSYSAMRCYYVAYVKVSCTNPIQGIARVPHMSIWSEDQL